ncbi:MAG: formyltetrahydrofolate deformylase [Flavobacteriaceae bacterium]|nr:formyltetrahydrofolate deformylase [Flavobacteriaceae bacterium]
MEKIIILINCPDEKGIISAVTNFIHNKKGNIVYIDQYVDRLNSIFFMRLECEMKISKNEVNNLKEEFEKKIGSKFSMNFNFFQTEKKLKMALLVSKYDHCLYDLLSRYSSNELKVEIPFIMSNHPDLKHIAERFNIKFYNVTVNKENKTSAEKEQLKIFKKHNIDFIVLARYMQILTNLIIDNFQNKIINIHHSFLPAFPGAKPYHSAYERGVKIIGATSHYVTNELDAGAIIEQNTTQVSHLNSIKDFIAKGRDLERIVLSKAVQLHVTRKVMVYKNKTVVFS